MRDLHGFLRTLGITLLLFFVPCLLADQFITAYLTPRYTAWRGYECFPDMQQCTADFDGDGNPARVILLGDSDYNRSLRITDGGASLNVHYRNLSAWYRTHLLRSPETARPRLLLSDRTNDPQLEAVYEWHGDRFVVAEPTAREQALFDAIRNYYGTSGAFFAESRTHWLAGIFLLLLTAVAIWRIV